MDEIKQKARELLATEFERDDFRHMAHDIRTGTANSHSKIALRALEQALTQQRGDDVESAARALFEAQADRLAAPWDRQWEPTKEHWRKVARGNLYATTPQPGAEALRELIAEWKVRPGVTDAYKICAEELESLLARGG